jgi:predicted phage terminase large subunit-like protein
MPSPSATNPLAGLFHNRPPPSNSPAPRSRDPLPNFPAYTPWLKNVSRELSWDWPHLVYARDLLADVTRGECDRLAVSWPPQHAKTQSVTVRYPLWRMLREPGLRVGVASYNQRYANKISRWTRRIVRRLGYACSGRDAADEWELDNGSTYIARGAGGGIAGEPLDLLVIDDPFKNREEADSQVIQERVYEWYMDDVTPRIQEDGAVVIIHTRWNPGDLIGRIKASEEGAEWKYINLKALCDGDDPPELADAYRRVGRPPRQPGDALCPERFSKEKLEQKRRVEGVGFESLYQQNPIPRGGTFFQREWFKTVDKVPEGAKFVRYWDLASSRLDSACYTSGVLMASVGQGEAKRFFVVDVVRGRWMPADRNDVMLQTARADETRPGFERTYFEEPVFDKGREACRGIVAKLAGHRVSPHNVSGSGSKELRAEPLADAAKAGLVSVVAGNWVSAWLTEMESFPRGQYADQVDSSSGGFAMINRGEWKVYL